MSGEDFFGLSAEERINRHEQLHPEEADQGLVPQFVRRETGEIESAVKTAPIVGTPEKDSGATRQIRVGRETDGGFKYYSTADGTWLAQEMAELANAEFDKLRPQAEKALVAKTIRVVIQREARRVYNEAYDQALSAQRSGF